MTQTSCFFHQIEFKLKFTLPLVLQSNLIEKHTNRIIANITN